MFTLNRLSLLGLGAGLVLVGCASPTDEAAEPTDESSAGVTAEANPEQTINDENGVPLAAEESAATEAQASDPQPPPVDPAQTEEGPTDSRSDKIFFGGGFGVPFGGFGGFGVPFGGFGGFGVPFGGFGLARGFGFGGVPFGGFGGFGGWGGWGGLGGCGWGACGRGFW